MLKRRRRSRFELDVLARVKEIDSKIEDLKREKATIENLLRLNTPEPEDKPTETAHA